MKDLIGGKDLGEERFNWTALPWRPEGESIREKKFN